MELSLLCAVVAELSGLLPGTRVERITPVPGDGIVLRLRGAGASRDLLLSAERGLPRIHLLSAKPVAVESTPPFVLSVRKHLGGSRLSGIRTIDHDRVVEMTFSRYETVLFLVFELLGGSSRLVLADGNRTILAVDRPIPPGEGKGRIIAPGARYEPPEKRTPPAAADMTPSGPAHGPDPLARNREAEAWFTELMARRERDAAVRALSVAIKKASARAERLQSNLREDLTTAERGDSYRRMGEMILANISAIGRGSGRIEVVGSDGRPVTIELDASRSPAENAERCFRRYKKAKAGLPMLRERLGATAADLSFLAGLLNDLQSAQDRAAVDSVRASLEKAGYLERPGRVPRGRSAVSSPYRTVHHDGWQILVGRSAAGNDYITMQLARPDDLWLHAEGMPGSHVLVRNPERRDVPPGVLRRAASLAAYYSKGRGGAKVPVAYTEAKFVAKPKGAAPGSVVLRERKSMMAVPEPA